MRLILEKINFQPIFSIGQERVNAISVEKLEINLSHCSARFVFNPLFVNWVTSLTPRVT